MFSGQALLHAPRGDRISRVAQSSARRPSADGTDLPSVMGGLFQASGALNREAGAKWSQLQRGTGGHPIRRLWCEPLQNLIRNQNRVVNQRGPRHAGFPGRKEDEAFREFLLTTGHLRFTESGK